MRALLLVAFALLALAAPAHAQQLTIGVAVPLTGSLAPLGLQIQAGAEAAAAQLNAAGGVLGYSINIQAIDDNCREDRGAAVANQFAGAGARLVVGHLCSAAAIAAAPVYAAEGIVQIAPGAPDGRFTDGRSAPNALRVYGRADDQGKVAGAFVVANFPDAVVAIVDDRTPYSRGIAVAVRDALAAAGVAALSDTFSRVEPDFDGLVGRLVASGVSFVYALGEPDQMGALRGALAAVAPAIEFMTGDVAADPDFGVAAGDAADGTLFTFPPDPRLNREAESAVQAIRDSGREPDGLTLYGFAAVEIWSQAVQLAGRLDYAAVVASLHGNTFFSVLGDVSFNEAGDMNLPGWIVWVWRDGRYQPFETAEPAPI